MIFAGGHMPKGAGAMPENEAQVGLILQGGGDL
jgi:hypothetical protein